MIFSYLSFFYDFLKNNYFVGRLRQKDHEFKASLGLHNKFHSILGNKARAYLKKPK
jgi:hypothetical protein